MSWSAIPLKNKNPRKVRIGEVVVKKGLITEAQLQQALNRQKSSGKKLGDVLIQEGLITRKQLDQALDTQYWQNLTATVFLSIGTLTTALPQVAVAQVSAPPRLDEQENVIKSQQQRQLSQGGNNSYLVSNAFSYANPATNTSGNSSNPDAISLASNPNPTEANPLRGFGHPLKIAESISQGHHGSTHNGRMEYAIDIAASIGTPIYAMRSGKVVRLEDRFPDTGGGAENRSKMNFVLIEHDGGYRSAYLHLKQGFISAVGIKVGDRVKAGELIGYTGNSGMTSGPHLHLEVHKAGANLTFGQSVPFQFGGDAGQVALHHSH